MYLRSGWHKQTADGSDDLGPAEYGLSTKILSKNTTDHLREYVTPVKRAENGRLNSWTPCKLTSLLYTRIKQLYNIARRVIELRESLN